MEIATLSDGQVHIWDFASDAELGSQSAESISALAFSPDGKTLMTGNYTGLVQLDGQTAKATGVSLPNIPVVSLAISADGKKMLIGDYDGNATLWDAKSFTPIKSFPVIRYRRDVPTIVPLAFLAAWCWVTWRLWRASRARQLDAEFRSPRLGNWRSQEGLIANYTGFGVCLWSIFGDPNGNLANYCCRRKNRLAALQRACYE